MKIAIVSDAIYPYNKGGKEKKIFETAIRFAKKGHDVHIYTMKWWKESKAAKDEYGIHLHAICPLYPLYSGSRRSFTQAIIFSLNCFKLLKEHFDVMDVDHMPHLVVFPLKIICLIKRKKLIVSWNEVWGKEYWKKYVGKIGYLAYYIEKLSIKLPNTIISISQHTTEKLQSLFQRTHHVYTMQMGINFKEIEKIPPTDKKVDIVFAGRLLQHKNVDLLIKAIAHIKKTHQNISCLVIGDGPEKNHLKKMISRYKVSQNITLATFFPDHKDLYAALKAAKIFAYPSLREGFGIAVIEANACGLPAVVVNHKDNAAVKLIKGINGKVVRATVQAFANGIKEFLQNPIDRGSISNMARGYDWDTIAENYLHIYKQ